MEIVKLIEPWGIHEEQVYHSEALQLYGEKVVLRLRWTVDDFDAGLVQRCPDCHAGATPAIQARVGGAYEDRGGDSYCPTCFGVGFEGGFRPIAYITFALIEDEPADWKEDRSGAMQISRPNAQFPWEPELHEHDLMIRVREWDGDTIVSEFDRYRLQLVLPVALRTGAHVGEPSIYIGQKGNIDNLSQQHPWRELEAV